MTPTLNEYYGKSIRIAPDGFSFYKHEGNRLAVKSFPHSSGALMSTEAPVFFAPGDALRIIAARHIPLLVPAELYSPTKARDYLALQFDTSRIGQTYSDPIGNYRAVYSLNQNDVDTLARLPFPHQVVSETALTFQMLGQLNAVSALYVGIDNDFLDVAAVHRGEPLLANRFPLTDPTDILFYVLHIIRQLNLHTPDMLLHFHGGEDRKLLQLFKKYQIKPIILQ